MANLKPLTDALVRCEALADELRQYSADCIDARTWGGPTIYPASPVTHDRAYQIAQDIKKLTILIRSAMDDGK